MSPLPTTRVIHPGWSAHHQPTAEGTMNARCSIHDGSSGPEPWPPVEGWTPDGEVLAADLPCRVQPVNQGNTVAQAEQLQGVRMYLVSVPVDRAPAVMVTDRGPIIVVHSSDDPLIGGLRLRVVDEQHSSYVFTRDYVCTHNQTQDG